MDKKTGIILGIISAIIVVLVAAVFVMDANYEPMENNILFSIEGKEYTTDEVQKFLKIYNHENGDINKEMTEDETLSTMDEFLLQKIYYNAAQKNNIKIDSGERSDFESDYHKDEQILLAANITENDYINYRTEKAVVEQLKYNLSDYYELPNEIYEAVRDAYIVEDMYNTYAFRLMTIPYEEPKSGDESGEVVDILEEGLESGDVSGDEEKEDLSRDAQLAVAENVLERIKSGDSFEELAKEYGSTRLTFKGNEYTLVNGNIEYAVTPLLESKLNSTALYEKVLEMKSGDVSEVIEDKESTSFQIVKIESVEEGFVGEGKEELENVLLSEYANDVVASDAHYEMNQSAYLRMLYKK